MGFRTPGSQHPDLRWHLKKTKTTHGFISSPLSFSSSSPTPSSPSTTASSGKYSRSSSSVSSQIRSPFYKPTRTWTFRKIVSEGKDSIFDFLVMVIAIGFQAHSCINVYIVTNYYMYPTNITHLRLLELIEMKHPQVPQWHHWASPGLSLHRPQH